MRNQFRKPKNVNCANSVFPKQTVLEAYLCERSEHRYASTQYDKINIGRIKFLYLTIIS